MNKKKNTIMINQLSKNLFFKNKISILIIFFLTIFASFAYNKYFKIPNYEYSIKVNISNLFVSESEIIINEYTNDDSMHKRLLSIYLNTLPPNVQEKNLIFADNNFSLNFKSLGLEQINVDNFMNFINKEAQKIIFKQINTSYKSYLREYKKLKINFAIKKEIQEKQKMIDNQNLGNHLRIVLKKLS